MTSSDPVAEAFQAEAEQLDRMANTLEELNRLSPSPEITGEVKAYRAVATRLRNKAAGQAKDDRSEP